MQLDYQVHDWVFSVGEHDVLPRYKPVYRVQLFRLAATPALLVSPPIHMGVTTCPSWVQPLPLLAIVLIRLYGLTDLFLFTVEVPADHWRRLRFQDTKL